MKNGFANFIKGVSKALYRATRAVKSLFTSKRNTGSLNNASRPVRYRSTVNDGTRPVSVNKGYSRSTSSAFVQRSSRAGRKTNTWWKNKFVIAGACGLIIVIAVVLAITLPSPQKNTLASAGDSIAFDGQAIANQEGASAAGTDTQGVNVASVDQSGVSTDLEQNVDNVNSLEGETSVPLATASAEPTAIPTTAPDKADLVPGCHDTRIIEIQQRLMELDYMDDDEPTDYYGSGTEYALQLFQRKHSLQVDGILGEQTLLLLFANDAKPYTVKVEDRGSDVKGIQERLQELNYLKAGDTGYFGTDTESAVKAFQKRNGLSPDGNVGEYTREVLYSEDAKPAKTSSGSGGSSSGGSSGGGSGPIAVGDPNQASVDLLIEVAKSKLGCEYTRAGKGPNEFDCSGFVYYCLNTAGYQIKYMTSSGWAKCGLPRVESMSDMKRGDIICFKGHVGIYLGDGQMIDAGSSSDSVRICSNIFNSSYWTRTFICARRVF